ncbi:MAG: DinB family protein [Acidobacteriota bacterium]
MRYTQKVLGLLGDQDPLQVMQRTVPALRSILASLSQGTLVQPEAEGKWSILEVVQHLADTEMVYGYRLRLALTLDSPRFNRFDQQAWASRFHYSQARAPQSLDQMEALRQPNLRILHDLQPTDLRRIGVHSQRGPQDVGQMMRLWAGHDLVHLAQIDRIRKRVSRQDAKSAKPI